MGKYMPKIKVIYLDQNHWINIAKEYYNPSTKVSDQKISHLILNSSNNKKAIFPLSIVHLNETLSRINYQSRVKLVKFMIKVSKGYTIYPSYSPLFDPEVLQVALKKFGTPIENFAKIIIAKGILNMLGVKGDSFNTDKVVSQILTNKLFANKNLSIRKMQSDYVEEMNKNRLELMKNTDKKSRLDKILYDFYVGEIVSRFKKLYFKLPSHKQNEITELFQEVNNKRDTEDIMKFLENMPALYCVFNMTYQRDILRPVKINDINDIQALSIAIPYCDIVVTDREMASFAYRAELGKKFDTTIFFSAEKLLNVI